jgi:PKD repeat protein
MNRSLPLPVHYTIVSIIFLSAVLKTNAQSILNGSFENNTAVSDQINLPNANFNSMMPFCNGFGTYGDIDIITSNTYCGLAEDGDWYIAFTGSGTDAVAFSLSSPLIAGLTYTVSFFDRGCPSWTPYPFDIGVSASNTSFGTTVLTGTQVPVSNTWTQRFVTFTAPFNADYITVMMNAGGLGDWAHIDNFCLGNCSPQVVAGFTAPNHICPGTCTGFTNTSLNGTTFSWSFPGANPAFSNDVNPVNICYNSPGNYPVTLIATGPSSADTLTLNNYITVYPFPAPQGISQSGDTLIANQGAGSYQWFYNGNLISGATDYYYIAAQSGNYNIVATDANGCEVEAVIFDVVAATGNLSDQPGFSIYPNPVKNILEIRFAQKLNSPARILILNMLGEDVLKHSVASNQSVVNLDISEFSSFFYYIVLENDGKISRSKFVKQ